MQEQRERRYLPQTTEHLAQKEDISSTVALDQGEQLLLAGKEKTEACLALLRRTQADLVQYRRHYRQQQVEASLAAQSALLQHLLPVLDDFGRTLGGTPPDLIRHPWVQGFFLIARKLTALFDQLGIQQVGMPGEQFNPHVHEAFMIEQRADVSEGTIVRVARPGYLLEKRVIYLARVVVAGSLEPMGSISLQQADSGE